ncbi:MAG: glutamate racemase [Pelolinea sp.]|nr:glutamate racemase [Pelolinea sp.]
MSTNQGQYVGVFDSGVGGLSVIREIHRLLPQVSLLYIADQAHVPYGKRQLEEIRSFSLAITHFLLSKGARLIVVACNTASAAALSALRETLPETPFVGMEPAVKPATQQTENGIVGVLATPATFQGRMYSTLVERFAKNVKLLTNTLPGLVEAVERGELESPATRLILKNAIKPMLAQGVDTLVLGCTHFPFVLPLIREIAGPDVKVIDPAPAIARRTAYLLEQSAISIAAEAEIQPVFATTGDVAQFKNAIHNLLNIETEPIQLAWNETANQLTEMRK